MRPAPKDGMDPEKNKDNAVIKLLHSASTAVIA